MSKPKTTLQVAAKVESAVDLGFVRRNPQAATVPRDWSLMSGIVKMAEKVTSRSRMDLPGSTTTVRSNGADTAEIVNDIELPDTEIGLNFDPEPIKVVKNYNILSLLLSIGVMVAVVIAGLSSFTPVSFSGIILVYVAYIAETVMFGPESEYFTRDEQHSPQEAATMLSRFIRSSGFIKIATGLHLDIIEFQRCLDNSSVIPADISARNIFDIFQSDKALLVLELKYKYDLFSEREENFIEQRITDFLQTAQIENTPKHRKAVRSSVLIVDNNTHSLPRIQRLVVYNPTKLEGSFAKLWLSFYTHVIMTGLGFAYIHRQIMASYLVEKRIWTCSKVFVADYDATVEFHINNAQGFSQFNAIEREPVNTQENTPRFAEQQEVNDQDASLQFNSALYGQDEVQATEELL